ncbi:MAG: hypothetical protein GXP47_13375 [Acidobacteria bacterium]|nr:hypothetical protein [Acidobacteriota bacterium]
MSNYVDVGVTYSGGRVECNPDPVDLHYEGPAGPDSVRWVLDTAVSNQRLKITWKEKSPFATMQTSADGRTVEGTDNVRVEGNYDYTVTVEDADGRPVAQLDPRVRNLP